MVTENYIVRIYRRDEINADKVRGVVEDIGARGKSVFENFDELRAILRSSEKRPAERDQSMPDN